METTSTSTNASPITKRSRKDQIKLSHLRHDYHQAVELGGKYRCSNCGRPSNSIHGLSIHFSRCSKLSKEDLDYVKGGIRRGVDIPNLSPGTLPPLPKQEPKTPDWSGLREHVAKVVRNHSDLDQQLTFRPTQEEVLSLLNLFASFFKPA